MLEQADEERLAHPAWAEEQEVAGAELFEHRQERRLVDVEVAFRADLGEVGHAVGDLHTRGASRRTIPPAAGDRWISGRQKYLFPRSRAVDDLPVPMNTAGR